MRYLGPDLSLDGALRDLGSSSLAARLEAIEALGQQSTHAGQISPVLRPLLDDDDPDVRYAAALALGRLTDTESVTRLIGILAGDPEPMPRQAAAVALGDIGDLRALEPLTRALHDSLAEVRLQAVSALPLLDSPAVADPLRQALQDEDQEVRATAAAGLGDIRDDASRDRLVRVTRDDPDPRVQFEAAMALARMGDRRGTPLLTSMIDHRDFGLLAVEHLFRCPDEAARKPLHDTLSRWLSSPLSKVWAAAALVRLGDTDARAFLQEQLHSRKEMVRGLTIQVLGKLDQPWSRKELKSLLEKPANGDWSRWRPDILQALGEGEVD